LSHFAVHVPSSTTTSLVQGSLSLQLDVVGHAPAFPAAIPVSHVSAASTLPLPHAGPEASLPAATGAPPLAAPPLPCFPDEPPLPPALASCADPPELVPASGCGEVAAVVSSLHDETTSPAPSSAPEDTSRYPCLNMRPPSQV